MYLKTINKCFSNISVYSKWLVVGLCGGTMSVNEGMPITHKLAL